MNIVRIQSMSDVILCNMQKEEVKTATFSEIWNWCDKCHLRHADAQQHKNAFVHRIFQAVDELVKSELVTVDYQTGSYAGNIKKIVLTLKGVEYLKPTHTVFSGQAKA